MTASCRGVYLTLGAELRGPAQEGSSDPGPGADDPSCASKTRPQSEMHPQPASVNIVRLFYAIMSIVNRLTADSHIVVVFVDMQSENQ